MIRAKKLIRFFLGLPLTLLAFLFLGKILFDQRQYLVGNAVNLNPVLFAIGVLLYSGFFILKALAWFQIQKKSLGRLPIPNALLTYSLSETKRYIPGNIFAFISRFDRLSPHIKKTEIAKGIAIEAILLILSATFVSLPSIIFLLQKLDIESPFAQVIQLLPLVLVILTTVAVYRFRSAVLEFLDPFFTLVLAWSFYSIASFLITTSIFSLSIRDLIIISSLFSFAWLVGYLSVIAPMGLGIREVVTAFGLSFFAPLAVSSIISIITRVTMIIGEIVSIFIFSLVAGFKKNNRLFSVDLYKGILVVSIFVYAMFFSFYTISKHNQFLTGRFDLGNMSQTVWNSSRGNLFQLTDPDGTKILTRLAHHSDFTLILLSPLYWIWGNPIVLLVVQTVVIAAGAYFVYGISNKILGNKRLSLAFSISYLLNFWVQQQNSFDFHSVSMATTFLLGAFYFLQQKRLKIFIIFLLLAVLTKENVFLVSFLFGLYFVIKRKFLIGIPLSFLSITIFYLLMTRIIPEARGSEHFAASYLSYLGDSSSSIIGNFVRRPDLLFSRLFSIDTLNYLKILLLPTGFLSIISPVYLLFALPDILINLTSTNSNLRSYYYHYGAVIIPFTYISSVYGAKLLLSKYKKIWLGKILFYYVLTFALFSLYLFSPIPGMKRANVLPFSNEPQNGRVRNYLKIIPENAKVAATNNVAAHLSHRDYIFVLPLGIDRADYIVIYKELLGIEKRIDDHNFELQRHEDNFFLFKRRGIN